MRILVAVAEVAVVDGEFDIEGQTVPDRFLRHECNEWDQYALAEAVRIANEVADVEVVTVTIGPERAEETIDRALAAGADRAIRIWDDALAAKDLLDPATKADLIARVAREEGPDLVLAGAQSAGEGFGATGVTLAERLGFEWAAAVDDLDLNADAGVAHVRRELEDGVRELTDVRLPAVLTVQTGITELPTGVPDTGEARDGDRAVLNLDDLGLRVAVDGHFEQQSLTVPEAERETTLFEGAPAETAAELAAVLCEAGVDR
ncbi:electron transfer flavoprotein subunit beta/FixA family protein [Halomicrobium salinisoli]|uniref:electron transfer flavoprotein subunit beta/FixA family protein n=1 Tax=Halomicrobium salinisoli TaxID=2878391 RepID=UPI001CF0AD6A|nr:electron transfer flavoprotein subunit beta/FixA family protein [Halomicrobium salinisoli]